MDVKIPARLAFACANQPERSVWLRNLPNVVHDLEQRWSLTVARPFDGREVSCAWVAPVTRADQSSAILKIGMPHMEAEHEVAGLRFWDGNPTVRLLAAADDLGAMLLERCDPGTHLRQLPEPEQDVIIAGLLRRLWRAPSEPHSFRPLCTMTAYWASETLKRKQHWPDPALVSGGLRLFDQLSHPASDDVLLATDLHAGNVLRAQREPWLVIDPKPFIGDAAFDATQHLFNCHTRLISDPDRTIRRFAELLGLDHERLRLWTFARAAVQSGDDPHNNRWLNLARVLARISGRGVPAPAR